MKSKQAKRQELFLAAVTENTGAFYRYAYSVLLNRQDAEDAVSEMILKAFSHLDCLRQLSKMRSWMFQILANTCRDILSEKEPVFDAAAFQPPDKPAQEAFSGLRDEILGMEAKFREVVILYYYEEMKTKEIANILQISEGTVKSRLSRAREKLKAFLESQNTATKKETSP
ncbi:MAG: RNA polymerase sigma factor [Eubacterium sp.]|nr:RNA polymerase sigma factor [Eubacterium sp.]